MVGISTDLEANVHRSYYPSVDVKPVGSQRFEHPLKHHESYQCTKNYAETILNILLLRGLKGGVHNREKFFPTRKQQLTWV